MMRDHKSNKAQTSLKLFGTFLRIEGLYKKVKKLTSHIQFQKQRLSILNFQEN